MDGSVERDKRDRQATSEFEGAQVGGEATRVETREAPAMTGPLTPSQQAILARIAALEESIAECGSDSARGQALSQVLRDYHRLWQVRANVEQRSDELKKHYFRVFKERNVYFKKLRMIEYYGEEHEWANEEDGGLLESIHQHLNQNQQKA